MEIRYLCGYALETECHEICRHVSFHGRTHDCGHRPCPHDAGSCIPFIGQYPMVKENREALLPDTKKNREPRSKALKAKKED